MSAKRNRKKRRSAQEKRAAAKRKAEPWRNRPWRPSPGTPAEVASFMQELGLVQSLPKPTFEKAIVARFGELGRDFLAKRPTSRACDQSAANAAWGATLDLALAVDGQFLGDLYEKFMSRLVRADLPPARRIVDVGAGTGVLTCFYGRIFPNAEVLGIDICPEMARCAQELAAKLGIENVSFEVADALDLPEHLVGQQFDLVSSTFVAHEVGELHGKPARTIEEAWARPVDRRLAGYAEALSGLLEPTGVLVTFERLGSVIAFTRWARALHDAGVEIDCERVETIEFVESQDHPSKLPLLLGSKNRGAEVAPNEIRTWWLQKMCPDELLNIVHEMAEAVFAMLRPTTLLEGLHFKLSDDLSQVHHEVWEAGPLAVRYRYKNGGRDLTFVPTYRIQETIHDMDPRNTAGSGFFDLKKYRSPEEADDDHAT